MIITNLIGGLGNQLFQYAAGRALAEMHQVNLKINTLDFEQYKLHSYGLHHFNISAEVASKEEVERYASTTSKIRDKITFTQYYKRRVFHEQFYNYDQNFKKAPNNTMLFGYWQSEKYFSEIAGKIRNEFTIKSPTDPKNQKLASDIVNANAVSIHIRRGDYVQDANTNNVHGTCDLVYYGKGVEKIVNLVKDPIFYIFSDDPQWVKANLRLKFPSVYIDHNTGEKSYEDLRLMSLCKHNIIANSTFSWWGAWLNTNPGKHVLVPEKWFNESTRDAKDLIPAGWQRI